MENSNVTDVPLSIHSSISSTTCSSDEAWEAAFGETSGLPEDANTHEQSNRAVKEGKDQEEEGPCRKEESSIHLDSELPCIQPGVVAVQGINHHHHHNNSMDSIHVEPSKTGHEDSLGDMNVLTAELVEEEATLDEMERARILEEAKQQVREELQLSASLSHAVAVLIGDKAASEQEVVLAKHRWQCWGIAAVLLLGVVVLGVMYQSEIRDNPAEKLRAGTCGEGSFGNGICSNEVECCSEFGFCGNGTEYCGIVDDDACGGGHRGNGLCANELHCCSEYGYCGTTAEHCSNITNTCGGGTRGNGVCSNGKCCSPHGYCGTTSVFCSSNISETCGGGYRGNGICPDKQQCCTELGLCGFCD